MSLVAALHARQQARHASDDALVYAWIQANPNRAILGAVRELPISRRRIQRVLDRRVDQALAELRESAERMKRWVAERSCSPAGQETEPNNQEPR